MQAHCVTRDPEQYFVPPYVGTKGWLGVRLGRDPSWKAVAEHVRAAWLTVAAATLAESPPEVPEVAPPSRAMRVDEIDPLQGEAGLAWRRVDLKRMLRAADGA